MVALIGKHADDKHLHSDEIWYKNWQAFEIAKNYEKGNGLVCVKLVSSYDAPMEAYDIGAKWVYSFSLDGINNVRKELSKYSKSKSYNITKIIS